MDKDRDFLNELLDDFPKKCLLCGHKSFVAVLSDPITYFFEWNKRKSLDITLSADSVEYQEPNYKIRCAKCNAEYESDSEKGWIAKPEPIGERILAGFVAVDSGRVLIVDPTYKNQITATMEDDSDESADFHQFAFPNSGVDFAVQLHSGFGDGHYEVWVTQQEVKSNDINYGVRNIKAEIIFITEKEQKIAEALLSK